MFTYYVRIVIAFAFGEINILLLLTETATKIDLLRS